MSRAKPSTAVEKRREERERLYALARSGELSLVQAVRMMRAIAGKTQAEYAKLVSVSPRVLIDFERGVGNPTLMSLERMLRPFGMELTVRRQNRERPEASELRFEILDASHSVIAQARTLREAMEIARASAKAKRAPHFVSDTKRPQRVVVEVVSGADRQKRPNAIKARTPS